MFEKLPEFMRSNESPVIDPRLGNQLANTLAQAGFTMQKLAETSNQEILAIPGISRDDLWKIRIAL